MPTASFDLAIVGSGPGGYRAAVLAARRGLSVALVEKDAWGGACLNRGCVPKKVWYQTARIAAASRRFGVRGLQGELRPDAPAAWRHQRDVVQSVRASYVDYLRRLGVRAVAGEAQLAPGSGLRVGAERLDARHVILATGSRPALPALRGAPVLDTDALFENALPAGRRVALVGGGPVGAEMAFILSQLGFELAWYVRREPLSATRFSRPARERLAGALAAIGVFPRPLEGDIRGADWILAGTGRVPNVAALGLEEAGVALTPGGFIAVDDLQRTSAPRVYAIGDCANPAMTANHALAEAGRAVASILGEAPVAGREWVPEVLYSATELARAGETEDALDEAGREYRVGFSAFSANPAALAADAAEGYVRLLYDDPGPALLGCEIVGPEAGELVNLVCRDFAHPSLAEELVNAAEAAPGINAPEGLFVPGANHSRRSRA